MLYVFFELQDISQRGFSRDCKKEKKKIFKENYMNDDKIETKMHLGTFRLCSFKISFSKESKHKVLT